MAVDLALSRRTVLKAAMAASGGVFLGGALAGCTPTTTTATLAPSTATPATVTNPDEALQVLMDGNARFVAGQETAAPYYTAQRIETIESQSPFAVILGCADSRVPPEIIFDQGVGSLFVVRAAGNTATTSLIQGSVEYGTEELGGVLVMVLGHQNCGAVKAALASVTKGATTPGQIPDVVAPILPAAQQASSLASADQLDGAITANVKQTVTLLKGLAPLLTQQLSAGQIKIVGGEYQLDTGKVTLVA
jgi:carbonic anhydrase